MSEYERLLSIWSQAEEHITILGKAKPKLMDCTGDLEGCRYQGKAFSGQGKGRNKNPYPKGTAEHEWFDAGWSEELEELCGGQ